MSPPGARRLLGPILLALLGRYASFVAMCALALVHEGVRGPTLWRVLETDADDMIAREHDCWFSAEHAAKDSGIAGGLAKEKKISLPLNAATTAQYERMVALGIGGLDKSGIAELTFPGRAGTEKKKAEKKKSGKKK